MQQKNKTPTINPATMQSIVELARLGQLTKIRESLEREHLEGRIIEETLLATDKLNDIHYYQSPLANAAFSNDGPDTGYISINNSKDWKQLKKDDSISVDFTKAKKRIEIIYYKAKRGETASIIMTGKY